MPYEIVPLKHEHLAEWYGEEAYQATIKGVAAYVDGNLAAVAGFHIVRGTVVAFCGLSDAARPFKKTIHKTGLELMEEAKGRHKRILALCDPKEPTAPNWLKRLGFRQGDGDVWEWRISV